MTAAARPDVDAGAVARRPRLVAPLLFPLLGALIAALALLSICVGPAKLSPLQALRALFVDDGAASVIVRELRLPRTVLALIVGGSLGLAGAALQGLLRNPLAEPAILGAPQAAALCAVLALHFAGAAPLSLAVPAAAIAGALLSVALVILVARRAGGVTSTLLAGIAIASLAGALTAFAVNLAPNPWAVTEIVFWLMGSVEDRSMVHVAIAAPFALAGAALILMERRALRLLTLGEETAASLGADLARATALIALGVALGVGAGVATAGTIGFVGLAAAHLTRRFCGHDPARTLVPAGLAGAALLLGADILVRLIPSNGDLKLGVVTALVGAPLFVWIALTRRAALGGPLA